MELECTTRSVESMHRCLLSDSDMQMVMKGVGLEKLWHGEGKRDCDLFIRI